MLLVRFTKTATEKDVMVNMDNVNYLQDMKNGSTRIHFKNGSSIKVGFSLDQIRKHINGRQQL